MSMNEVSSIELMYVEVSEEKEIKKLLILTYIGQYMVSNRVKVIGHK